MLLGNNRIVVFCKERRKLYEIDRRTTSIRLLLYARRIWRFNEDSDVDMVVDFDKVTLEDYADNYFDLKFSLEDIFGREVDLLEDKAIRNPILRRNIDNSKVLVYGFANDN